MRIHWTETAEGHLDNIYRYIAKHSEEYAKRIVDKITTRTIQIKEFPMSGRVVPRFNIKQIRQVREGQYWIVYYIKSDQIDILAVLHGAQNILKEI